MQAFEHLYRRHVGRTHALCLRLTAEAALAEELTQETFVRAWQKLDSFRGESAFASWLYRLTVNVVLSERRARHRRQTRTAALHQERGWVRPAAGASPSTRVALEEAIAQLPEGARTVFVLHDVEGYRHDEIATLTGMAPGTSKAQLHRARTLLRKELSL